MFGVPWTAFVADGSPFFINDILHLRAELTIKTESDEDHLYGELLILEDLDGSSFDESLDAILHEHAFRVMIHRRPHTGALYNATLPANLAGMKVSVVGLRSTTLWRKGYSMVTPVVGLLVYDASHLSGKNLSKLELNTMGKPISIEFQGSMLVGQRDQRIKCAFFGGSGEVFLSEMSLPNVCFSTNQGHFSIVVPLEKKQKIWPLWVVGFLAGFVGLILVGLAGTVAVRSFVGTRTQEMEKEADDGECLQTYWISSSKMPLAEVTRTRPVLETTALPNPKLSWMSCRMSGTSVIRVGFGKVESKMVLSTWVGSELVESVSKE
ncbi:UNVERIFIED_CONTAM: BTB/POZ domain-containing protein POB1 [Sesamum radiatum]|uniref:BTB/POZ domain-containing protein POB1 n=1 Tax=Sesamum radiatum TaxID=300843 RepID=A0AAW2L2L0_SESRA